MLYSESCLLKFNFHLIGIFLLKESLLHRVFRQPYIFLLSFVFGFEQKGKPAIIRQLIRMQWFFGGILYSLLYL